MRDHLGLYNPTSHIRSSEGTLLTELLPGGSGEEQGLLGGGSPIMEFLSSGIKNSFLFGKLLVGPCPPELIIHQSL